MSFTGKLTFDDMKYLAEVQARIRGHAPVKTIVAVVAIAFFGFSALFLILFDYSYALWLPAAFMTGTFVVLLPSTQYLHLRRWFKKYPPMEHTVELFQDHFCVRTASSSTNSSWENLKEVWRTSSGYVFINRYDSVAFFLPIRLFPGESEQRSIDELLKASGVIVQDK